MQQSYERFQAQYRNMIMESRGLLTGDYMNGNFFAQVQPTFIRKRRATVDGGAASAGRAD